MAKGTKTGGRAKGTPNKKTQALVELLGDYNPVTSLIKIVQDKNTSLDMQVKINLDLLPYIYPKRKAIEITETEQSSERTIKELSEFFKNDGKKVVNSVIDKLKDL